MIGADAFSMNESRDRKEGGMIRMLGSFCYFFVYCFYVFYVTCHCFVITAS